MEPSSHASTAPEGQTEFRQSMSVLENISLGFTYLSPVVGSYTLFDTCLALGGGPMIWSYIFAGIGQFLVSLIFGEVVSQFPIAGGIYPWCRRLAGRRWAWIAAWVYAWALFASVAGVATGATPFLALLIGAPPGPETNTAIAVFLILVSTLCNVSGTKFLARVAMFGCICELVGALAVGGYLLLFHRMQPLSVLFDSMGAGGHGPYWVAFLAAAQLGLFSCYGFEACGDVAEEIADAGRKVPKAMRMTIYIGVGASIFACLALLLAVSDIRAVINGQSTTPLRDVLLSAFGQNGARVVAAIVMVSFMSCVLSLQAVVSRLMYSFARDKMVIGSAFLARLSPKSCVPIPALIVSGIIPSAIVLCGLFLQNALNIIVSFAVSGIYIAFQMVVLAALYARIKGWSPSGAFRLGVWAWPVNILATLYGFGAVIDILWPRSPNLAWYLNYDMLLAVGAVLAMALVYMVFKRPHERGNAPYGDAWRKH